jgi:hypothetical protein
MNMDAWLHFPIDVIIPTAHQDKWPANVSIPWNKHTANLSKNDVRFIVIESSGPSFSFSKSINRGLEQRRLEAYALLLNDDCFLDSGWVTYFRSAVRCHPLSGIFGALLRFPPGHHGNWLSGKAAINHGRNAMYQHAGGFFPVTREEIIKSVFRFAVWNMAPLWLFRQFIRGTGFRFPGHYHRLSPRNRIHLITAAAMLLTPLCIEKVGIYDENYPIVFQDTAYCLKALEMGFEPCLVSDATGTHYESVSTRKMDDAKKIDYQRLLADWPIPRLREVIGDHRGIVHPLYCGCGEWIE